jgi:hypothetical protein
VSGEGKPSDLHPRGIARDLGLPVPSGPVTFGDLLNAACDLYWQRRPEQSPRRLAEYRRRQQRRRTRPEVWQRRAGEAA